MIALYVLAALIFIALSVITVYIVFAAIGIYKEPKRRFKYRAN